MAQLKRNLTMWLIRMVAVLTVALAALVGVTGQAFAHDDDTNDEAVTYGPNACTVVANLPVTTLAATCVKHKIELDDGVTETKNSWLMSVQRCRPSRHRFCCTTTYHRFEDGGSS